MFTDELKKQADPIIEAIYNDDFIQGIIRGDINKDAIRHYLKADHLYLNEFAKIYSLLIAKLNDREGINFLLGQIDFVLNGEIAAHQTMADYVGEDYDVIIKDGEWYPSSDHYIKHMYYNAFRYDDASFTICAMAPCPYVYQQLALKIAARHELTGNPLKPWVDFYTVNMDELMNHLDRWVNNFAEQATEYERDILRRNFLESCVHERRFFNMAARQEEWIFHAENSTINSGN
ncbi:thiaminase II [Macrococcus equipercicus]|uniref:Aminopyrimidine aminohydrolase n=1 Tax=Macrococcus equipercicus TaxID=69967 RepID=A0ABQ6R7Z7_9STAP|nr:thiaminase II [Macrococcus equipercicus]KAA1039238.1 thiaminase II [Macrococcus equipercicus]